MTKIFINEKIKTKLQELTNLSKPLVICENWHDFANNYKNKVGAIVLPHQTKNGMWGVVAHWRDFKNTVYFSASKDVSEEIQEVSQLSKLYTSLDLDTTTNYYQNLKINTNDDVEFSVAYINYIVEKFIEYHLNPIQSNWDKVNVSGSIIDNYKQSEEYKNLKNDNDLDNLKNKISQWESAIWTKDPQIIKTWYDNLSICWRDNLSKDYGNGLGVGADGLVRIKKKLDQLEKDNQQLKGLQVSNYLLTEEVNKLKENELKRKLKIIIDNADKKLEKYPIDLYCNRKNEGKFTGAWSNAVGLSDWRKKIVNGKEELDYSGFYIHVRIDRPPLDVFYTLAHEMAHLIVLLRESEKQLFPDQLHSKTFWNDFFLDYIGSTFAFVKNNLEGEEKKEFAKLLNPITNGIENNSINQKVYSPMIISKWENKKLMRKKTFASLSAIDKESKEVMKLVLGLAEEGMQESDWKGDYESKEKRKVQIEFDKQEIRVYYDESLPTKPELENKLVGLGFTQEEIIQQQQRSLLDQQIKEESYDCLFKIASEEKSSQLVAQIEVNK